MVYASSCDCSSSVHLELISTKAWFWEYLSGKCVWITISSSGHIIFRRREATTRRGKRWELGNSNSSKAIVALSPRMALCLVNLLKAQMHILGPKTPSHIVGLWGAFVSLPVNTSGLLHPIFSMNFGWLLILPTSIGWWRFQATLFFARAFPIQPSLPSFLWLWDELIKAGQAQRQHL